MSEPQTAYRAEANGEALRGPEPPGLPVGSLVLPPGMVARLTRLLAGSPAVQDLIASYVDGKGAEGPFALVVPTVILVKQQQEGQG